MATPAGLPSEQMDADLSLRRAKSSNLQRRAMYINFTKNRPVIAFSDFELDLNAYELRQAGHRIVLARREMDVLILLARNAGRLITRQEIAATLWRSGEPRCADAVINSVICRVRAALQDNAANPRFIAGVVGKGYRFIGVEETSAKPLLVTAACAVGIGLAAAISFAVYGVAIALFVVSCVLLLGAMPRFNDTVLVRFAVASFLLAGASYSLSAWNLSHVSQSVVNMETLKPAVLYPFITGLRFIPMFVLVMTYWVVLRTSQDVGFSVSSFHRTMYGLMAAVFLGLTVTAVALGYGDYEIWKSGIRRGGTILACYAIVLAINIIVAIVAFRYFNQPRIVGYGGLFARCAVAFVTLAIPALVVDHQYYELNRHNLDKRRTRAYVASNPGAIVEYRRRIAAGPSRNAGSDFVSLINDEGFERALRAERFYRQDFDEPFQILDRSVILAYRHSGSTVPDSTVPFTFVRFPSELLRALRFEAVED